MARRQLRVKTMKLEVYIVQSVVVFLLVFVIPILLFSNNSLDFKKEYTSISSNAGIEISASPSDAQSKKPNRSHLEKKGTDYVK